MLSPVILGAKKLPSTCCIKITPIAAIIPLVTDPVSAINIIGTPPIIGPK